MNHYNQEMIIVSCPYCGENIDPLIDYSDPEQQYYEDCSVCCAPILFKLSLSVNGEVTVLIQRDDD